MAISQEALASLYFYALLLGVFLGAVYDLLRITRVFLGVHYSHRTAKRLQQLQLPLLKPKGKKRESRALGVVVFLEDFLFCLFAGILLILLFYELNNGKIRYLAFLCAGAGFLLYRGTLGRLVMLFSEMIAFVLETAFRYMLFFFLFPLRYLIGKLKKAIAAMRFSVAKKRQKQKRKVFTQRERDRGMRDACGLIPESIPKSRSVKRGKLIGKQQKAIQPNAFNKSADCCAGGCSRRRVRK